MSELASSSQKPVKCEAEIEDCTICMGKLKDPANLDNCSHQFCFVCICEWLRRGPGPVCPMCKSTVSRVFHISAEGNEEDLDISDIRPTFQPVPVEQPNVQSEKRIISWKSRECRRHMLELDKKIAQKNAFDNIESLELEKRTVVSHLNALQMLRDDIRNGSSKAMIVSKVDFRKILYTDPIETVTTEIEAMPQRVTLKRMKNISSTLENSIIYFISEELKSIPISNVKWPKKFVHDIIGDQGRSMAIRLFELCKKHMMKSSIFLNEVVQILPVDRVTAEKFVKQLYWMVESGVEFLEFCSKIGYRLKNERNSNRNIDYPEEIVTLSDNDDDDDEVEDVMIVESPSSRQRDIINRNNRRRLANVRVINGRECIFPSPFLSQNAYEHDLFTSYFPRGLGSQINSCLNIPTFMNRTPIPISLLENRRREISSSDSDDNATIYRRDLLRLPQSSERAGNFPTRATSTSSSLNPIVIDEEKEKSWQDLTSHFALHHQKNQEKESRNDKVELVNVGDDDGQNEEMPTSSTAAQASNETIVLNDSGMSPEKMNEEPSSSTSSLNDETMDRNRSIRRKHRIAPPSPPKELVGKMEELLDEFGYKERAHFKIFKNAAEEAIKKRKKERKREREAEEEEIEFRDRKEEYKRNMRDTMFESELNI